MLLKDGVVGIQLKLPVNTEYRAIAYSVLGEFMVQVSDISFRLQLAVNGVESAGKAVGKFEFAFSTRPTFYSGGRGNIFLH